MPRWLEETFRFILFILPQNAVPSRKNESGRFYSCSTDKILPLDLFISPQAQRNYLPTLKMPFYKILSHQQKEKGLASYTLEVQLAFLK